LIDCIKWSKILVNNFSTTWQIQPIFPHWMVPSPPLIRLLTLRMRALGFHFSQSWKRRLPNCTIYKLVDLIELNLTIFARKEQESTAAGLAKPAGWAPLAQVLAAVIQSQNLARQERAFAVLVQLISFTPSGAAGLVEEAGNLAALTLAALGTGGQRKSCDEVRDEHFEQEMKQSIQSAREAALHALKTLLSKVGL
jgi:hypothetical protein